MSDALRATVQHGATKCTTTNDLSEYLKKRYFEVGFEFRCEVELSVGLQILAPLT